MTTLRDLNGTYAIDPTHSRVGFVVRHAMVTKVRGAFTVNGEAHFEGANPAASNINVTVDVASVDSGNADRDNHLRTSDFFAIEQYPTMTFTSTGVELVSDNEVNVTGDLTIKDVTRQVTLPMEFAGQATDPFGNERVGFEGSTTVNRSDFGLNWNAALEAGGVLVSEKATLEFEISLIKQA